jgi:hypothetical protein
MWLRLLDILGGHVQPSNDSTDLFTGFSKTQNRLESNLDDEETFMGVLAKFTSGEDVEILMELQYWKNVEFKVCMATFYLTPAKPIKCREKKTMALWCVQN